MMKRPEQIIQQGVFETLIPLMHLQKYKQFMAFQIRNETGVAGSKGAVLGAIAKSMGTMEGASDTVFLFPSNGKEGIDFKNPTATPSGVFYPVTRVKNPPKTVFVEFKAMKPLKTRERHPTELLDPAQLRFKMRVEDMGFEYRIIAATDVQDALNQVWELLRENGVKL